MQATAPNNVAQPEFTASQGAVLMAIPRDMKVPSDVALINSKFRVVGTSCISPMGC